MRSRKRVVILTFIAFFVVSIASTGLLSYLANTPQIREVQINNPDGAAGKAFVVFRPGVSGFQEQITMAFVDGLTDNDWRVEVTTASSQTSVNISTYDLIVLGSPVYGGEPSQYILDYISNLSNFQGIPTVIIMTAAGTTDQAADIMTQQIQARNSTVILSLGLLLLSPNQEQYGSTDPLVIATNAGRAIPSP